MDTRDAHSRRTRVQQIGADNPHTDIAEVDKALQLVDELRDLGMSRPKYAIESPYERHRRGPSPRSHEDHPAELQLPRG